MTPRTAFRLVAPLASLACLPHAGAQIFELHELTLTLDDPVPPVPIDYDGDGDLDLVALSSFDGLARILIQQGPGRFVSGPSLVGLEPGALSGHAADLNGDGRDDLVLVTTQGELVCWRNEGTSQPWTRVVLDSGGPGGHADFASEDFNGDGVNDLVMVTGTNDVITWYPSGPAGSIGPGIPIAIGTHPRLQLTDVNGDGIRDLITKRSGTTVAWLESDGMGGFIPLSITHGDDGATLMDADADGLVDIVSVVGFPSPGGLSLNAFLQRGLPGGQFAPRQIRGTVGSWLCVFGFVEPLQIEVTAMPDRNSDGFEELLLGTPCIIQSPYIAFRSTTSTGPADWENVILEETVPPQWVDLDADGDGDQLITGESLTWVRSLGGGQFQFAGPLLPGAGRSAIPALADLNRDGLPELVAAPLTTNSVAIFDGVGRGSFIGPRFSGFAATVTGRHEPRRMADVDGDGEMDLVQIEGFSSVGWRPGDGLGAFGAARILDDPTPGALLTDVAVRDLDGDGTLDVIAFDQDAALVVWLGRGGGAFGVGFRTPAPTGDRMTLGDVDGDGDVDVVTASSNGSQAPVNVYRWEGAGFLSAVQLPVMSGRPAALVDLDLDGDQDAVLIESGILRPVVNNGASGWAPAPPLPIAGGLFAGSVAAGDLDGDGFSELVAASNGTAGAIAVYFAGFSGYEVGSVQTFRREVTEISLVDVDADGDLDVLGAGEETVAWYENLLDHSDSIGAPICAPGIPNSTGSPGSIAAAGSTMLALRDVTLTASSLPLGSSGYFLASRASSLTFPVSDSQGRLCLGGSIGRYIGPGQVQNSGAVGEFSLELDLAAMPTPTGPTLALPGSTWFFQAWFRDANPASTSNFTDAVAVTFE